MLKHIIVVFNYVFIMKQFKLLSEKVPLTISPKEKSATHLSSNTGTSQLREQIGTKSLCWVSRWQADDPQSLLSDMVQDYIGVVKLLRLGHISATPLGDLSSTFSKVSLPFLEHTHTHIIFKL